MRRWEWNELIESSPSPSPSPSSSPTILIIAWNMLVLWSSSRPFDWYWCWQGLQHVLWKMWFFATVNRQTRLFCVALDVSAESCYFSCCLQLTKDLQTKATKIHDWPPHFGAKSQETSTISSSRSIFPKTRGCRLLAVGYWLSIADYWLLNMDHHLHIDIAWVFGCIEICCRSQWSTTNIERPAWTCKIHGSEFEDMI